MSLGVGTVQSTAAPHTTYDVAKKPIATPASPATPAPFR